MPCAAVGRAAGFAGRRCARSIASLLIARRRRQHQPARSGVDDDRDAVAARSSASTSMRMRVAARAAACRPLIEPDTSSRNTRLRGGASSSAISRPCRPISASRCFGVPRALGELGRDRERRVARRLRIVVAEVVDQLLDAHRVRRRQRAVVAGSGARWRTTRCRRRSRTSRADRRHAGGTGSRRGDRRPRC